MMYILLMRRSEEGHGHRFEELAYPETPSHGRHQPTDVIKIDHFFVESLGEDIEAMAVLRMIIGLAHSLSY